jgi:hypothetical protein
MPEPLDPLTPDEIKSAMADFEARTVATASEVGTCVGFPRCSVCGSTNAVKRYGVSVDGAPLLASPLLCNDHGGRYLLGVGGVFKSLRHAPPEHQLDLSESDRQMVLLALAHLSVERPGWDEALNLLALQIDNQRGGRALMFDEFKELHEKPGA